MDDDVALPISSGRLHKTWHAANSRGEHGKDYARIDGHCTDKHCVGNQPNAENGEPSQSQHGSPGDRSSGGYPHGGLQTDDRAEVKKPPRHPVVRFNSRRWSVIFRNTGRNRLRTFLFSLRILLSKTPTSCSSLVAQKGISVSCKVSDHRSQNQPAGFRPYNSQGLGWQVASLGTVEGKRNSIEGLGDDASSFRCV